MEGPTQQLNKLATDVGLSVDSAEFAAWLDERDPLKSFRLRFAYPKLKDLSTVDQTWSGYGDGESECVYLCGNSLGLKPKMADEYMRRQLDKWGKTGVLMHFEGFLPAALCDLDAKPYMAELVGARESEVCLMNSLTVNLHLALQAFYRPDKTKGRTKILFEAHAFPSDRYAFTSAAEMHGLDPASTLVQLTPREGEETLRTEDILAAIDREGPSLSLVIFSGIQYYTGQLFDIEQVTRKAKSVGAKCGWDLAHAVGNVKLSLHSWGVDFAVWCSYKYLNSGAGGVGGFFLHSDHHNNKDLKRLTGWWSNKQETRFQMAEQVDLAEGAEGFRLANPSPWHAALNMASLEIFHEATMERIAEKQLLITGYLEYLIKWHFSTGPVTVKIITPGDTAQRGSQLSLVFSEDVTKIHKLMESRGIVCDFRRPCVIRVAPAPLYNSYSDVRRFTQLLKTFLHRI